MHIFKPLMEKVLYKSNWIKGKETNILRQIHDKDINIAVLDRDISLLLDEINTITNNGVEIRCTGSIEAIYSSLKNGLYNDKYPLLIQDVYNLIKAFSIISPAKSYRLLLSTIDNNMCKRFHTDLNDLRLLCTYKGPGTLWLKENNVNRDALETLDGNESIVIDKKQIQQASTGSVVILKGGIYPKEGTKAAVHMSPSIEESGEKRLLLRIDTNEFLNFS